MFWERLLTLEDLKKEPYCIQNILWDIDPTEIMAPILTIEGSEILCKVPIKGYVFYIETTWEKPELFLMMHRSSGYAETIAKIEEIPEDLIKEAVEENKDKIKFGMCPINEKIKLWLKRELELS